MAPKPRTQYPAPLLTPYRKHLATLIVAPPDVTLAVVKLGYSLMDDLEALARYRDLSLPDG